MCLLDVHSVTPSWHRSLGISNANARRCHPWAGEPGGPEFEKDSTCQATGMAAQGWPPMTRLLIFKRNEASRTLLDMLQLKNIDNRIFKNFMPCELNRLYFLADSQLSTPITMC